MLFETCMKEIWLVKILNEFKESEKKKEGNINLNVVKLNWLSHEIIAFVRQERIVTRYRAICRTYRAHYKLKSPPKLLPPSKMPGIGPLYWTSKRNGEAWKRTTKHIRSALAIRVCSVKMNKLLLFLI